MALCNKIVNEHMVIAEGIRKNPKTICDEVYKTESRRELQLHSDQGFQYTSQAYFDLMKEYGITPPMSRHGNCYDHALAEACIY